MKKAVLWNSCLQTVILNLSGPFYIRLTMLGQAKAISIETAKNISYSQWSSVGFKVAPKQRSALLAVLFLFVSRHEKTIASNNSELNPDTFTAFNISSVEQLTEDTYQYKFELPGNSSLRLSLGQHIVLRGVVNGLEVQRAYTPISPGNAEGYFEVLMKCYEAGLMSQYIKTWKKGDAVFWRGPFGGFPYQPNKHGELLMLASGTGLAPMLPILRSITDDEDDETFVTLVGCFRTFDKIYLKPLLQDLARYWNIRIFYVLSRETSLEKLPWSYQENTYTGRLNEDLMKMIINSCRRRPFVLICGSSAFNEDMSRYLKAAGIEESSCFVF
ncbi:NADH-cytochrome b5 reductase-like isoform X1 [Balearica regulorum gibbericeps]|uniref:NADH-cytochrome b5 reductase-like isoform X1 n=1 Tax=Balearica regulorum gibbericeps TaxID=100784 RepID=UPI003F5E72B3